MSFVAEMHRKYAADWTAMLAEPFLAQTADGSIPDERFINWLKQDFLFVRESLPFLAVMIPKAPIAARKPLSDAISGLHQELELFESMAKEHRVSLESVEPAPTTSGYIHFLLSTGALEPYELCYTALYTAEKAYVDSWTQVKEFQQQGPSKWQRFIENWTSETFRGWVSSLGNELDELAESASERLRARMEQKFVETMRYEIQFWRMAYAGESW